MGSAEGSRARSVWAAERLRTSWAAMVSETVCAVEEWLSLGYDGFIESWRGSDVVVAMGVAGDRKFEG